MDKSTGLEMENAQEPQSLLEWFTERYKDFGATLEFVTNRSQEGVSSLSFRFFIPSLNATRVSLR